MVTSPSPSQPTSSLAQSRVANLARTLTATSLLNLKRLWIWPIAAALLLGTIGWFLRGAIEVSMQEDLRSELRTILDTDLTALSLWLDSQESVAEGIARDPQVRATIETLIEHDRSNVEGRLSLLTLPELAQLRTELSGHLESHNFHGFAVLDREGRVVAAQRDEPIGIQLTDLDLTQGLQRALDGETTVTRPFKSLILLPDKNGVPRANVPTMFALAPVRDADGEFLAVLGLRMRPDDVFMKILNVAQTGETGETFAFDDQGLLLSESRFDETLREIGLLTESDDSMLNVTLRDPGVDLTAGRRRPKLPRSEQPLTTMVQAAVSGESGEDVSGYRDYRGVEVIGAWAWLDKYNFGIGTEIDAAEAYRPLWMVRYAFWSMFGLLFLASIVIFVFSLLVARLNRDARRAALEAKRLGRYRLEEKLGEGGMGVVYRAYHEMLQRQTAVKFLDIEKTNDQSIARFEREVRLTSQLTHPNTIAVYDYGRTDEGIFYYAMEYLTGLDLDKLVHRFGPQPEGRVIRILTQMCGSLAEAHDIGLIHRDIKPANVILNARGGLYDFVKVLDFGLAKAVDAGKQARLTSSGGLTGTPLYMSPEAISQADRVDSRSDLYAIGAVGYYLLTGTPVFEGESIMEIIRGHVESTPEPPSVRLGKSVSKELERLLLKCLEKDPSDRPASAMELMQELRACRTEQPWTDADAEQWWQVTVQMTPQNAAGHVSADTDRFAATIVSDSTSRTGDNQRDSFTS